MDNGLFFTLMVGSSLCGFWVGGHSGHFHFPSFAALFITAPRSSSSADECNAYKPRYLHYIPYTPLRQNWFLSLPFFLIGHLFATFLLLYNYLVT